MFPRTRKNSLRSPRDRPKTLCRNLHDPPGTPQVLTKSPRGPPRTLPRVVQDPPRTLQGLPWIPQDPPKDSPRSSQEPPGPPRTLQDPPTPSRSKLLDVQFGLCHNKILNRPKILKFAPWGGLRHPQTPSLSHGGPARSILKTIQILTNM